ncbi:MAG: oligopeptide transporter, OPT family [Bacteriovoracaceae bacterium]|nr:oligopeptide transporter, OPT family [Bacteriovoracaceae bacterium]
MNRELTATSIILGLTIGLIMTAATVYLGLYAGMTVSASIPAGVLAMGFYRGVLRRSDAVLESNIVQTMASAGESLAAGVIFTVPALLIVGAWNDFAFWPTTLIAACGGVLGVVFMVPLRKALIEDDKELIYPEGVACAQVLKAGAKEGDQSGFHTILQGLGISALFKFFSASLGIFKGSVEKAMFVGKSSIFGGGDISPALLAVGYIVGLPVSLLVLLGGGLAWLVAIPLMGTPAGLENAAALDVAWELWSTQVRYIGVGAMVVGGLWSLVSVRKSFVSGIKALGGSKETRKDLSPSVLGTLLLLNIVVMFGLYHSMIGSWGFTLITTVAMVLASFLFVAVSSYVVGLVGSSNNPVSGMTISALLGTSALFLVFGFEGQSAIIATLGVAGVVCCAACSAGDCSQDLKTGSLVGASPRNQQIAQIIGVLIPAFIIAPTLTLLHHAYGIGDKLKAPQATLFASLTKAIFGDGTLPMDKLWLGAGLGVLVIFIDEVFLKTKKFRLHLMPIAVGVYLPVTLATPMVLGGIVQWLVKRKHPNRDEGSDPGILLSSGLVAGESLMGVLVALLITFKIDLAISGISSGLQDALSVAALLGLALFLKKKAQS